MSTSPNSADAVRHDWTTDETRTLFELPLNDLLFRAQAAHRQFFDPNIVQMSNLLSVKTGGCPEDCGYCPQSAKFDTGTKAEKLMDVNTVVAQAEQAKAGGATRFCMGAAWRSPKDRDLDKVCEMVSQVRDLGMETCVTLGMLRAEQAERLRDAGLDYYNHNLDTSKAFYGEIITTRTYNDRLETLGHVRNAGLKVCAGGIVGMGESQDDRAAMLATMANLPNHPESVPINRLVAVEGTPLAGTPELDSLEFVRTIGVAKIMMPASVIRLSAGREDMSDELQALCFLAGAGSIFVGTKLLTTPNPGRDKDAELFARLGLRGNRQSSYDLADAAQ